MPKNCLHTSYFFCYSYSPVTCTKQRYLKRPCCYCVKCFNCELGAVPLCLNGFALLFSTFILDSSREAAEAQEFTAGRSPAYPLPVSGGFISAQLV